MTNCIIHQSYIQSRSLPSSCRLSSQTSSLYTLGSAQGLIGRLHQWIVAYRGHPMDKTSCRDLLCYTYFWFEATRGSSYLRISCHAHLDKLSRWCPDHCSYRHHGTRSSPQNSLQGDWTGQRLSPRHQGQRSKLSSRWQADL